MAGSYMKVLCVDIPGRQVGSAGNRVATDFLCDRLSSFGFEMESQLFDCIDWSPDTAHVVADGDRFHAAVSPYSLGCQAQGTLAVIFTVGELQRAELTGKIVLLHGEIAKERLMPKNFPFYNPERHQRIIRLLEEKNPAAIVTWPQPVFEDGDFDIPSIYLPEDEGQQLLHHVGSVVSLESRAERIPSTGCNVVARKGSNLDGRIVVTAHIDAHPGTAGAIDNAGGVVVLLLLAELLSDYSGQLGVELVAMNGEDYFSTPGERRYLAANSGKFDDIVLGVNVDGAGYHKGRVAFSLYDCPPGLSAAADSVLSRHGLIHGEPWYQGDHGLFLMNQRPALAITSELSSELTNEITHTVRDTPEIVDASKLANVAVALHDLVLELSQPK